MAEQKKRKVQPEMPEDLTAIMEAAKARVEERRGARSASDAVNSDKEPRKTFSLRLNARELHRLRVIAMMEDEGVTELARRLVLDGLARLEAKHLAESEDAKVAGLVEQLKSDMIRVVIETLTSDAAPSSVRDALRVIDSRSAPAEAPPQKHAM